MAVMTVNVNQVGSEFYISGVVDSHSALPLCSPKAGLSAKPGNLVVTPGGGIAFDFVLSVDDTTWREKEAADAQAMKEKQEADAEQAKVAAEAAAAKLKTDAEAVETARIAKIAAEVAKDLKANG